MGEANYSSNLACGCGLSKDVGHCTFNHTAKVVLSSDALTAALDGASQDTPMSRDSTRSIYLVARIILVAGQIWLTISRDTSLRAEENSREAVRERAQDAADTEQQTIEQVRITVTGHDFNQPKPFPGRGGFSWPGNIVRMPVITTCRSPNHG